MTLILLLSVATVITAVGFATYVARACRGAYDTARSLGESGTDVRQIARRTGLQQDVVSMLLAGRPAARQNIPVAAGTTSRSGSTPARQPRPQSRRPVAPRSAPRAVGAMRGTDVATV